MASRRSSAAVAAAYFAVLTAASPVARGAGEINQQVLQGVGAFNASSALDMLFDATPDERLLGDFEKLDITGAAKLASCQRNATRGLYCLDGSVVQRWTDPKPASPGVDPLVSQPQFTCAHPKLKLTGPEYCTALAIAQNGDAWIAGRRKGASVLIRLREKSDGTASGSCVGVVNTSLGPTERYCYQEFGFARPLLSKLVVVEGDEAAGFDRGTGSTAGGVLGLDIRNAVTYSSFNPTEAPIDLVTKNQWLLLQKETLQDLTLLQTESGNTADPIDNYLLVTTSLGRVLRYQTDAGASAPRSAEVFNALTYGNATGAVQCTPAGTLDRFGIAASNKTGRVYTSSRNRCQIAALEPAATGIRSGGLVNVEIDANDLTLSTRAVSGDVTLTYPPEGVTVTPGIAVRFDECEAGDSTPDNLDGCEVIALQEANGNRKTILRFSKVERATAETPSAGTVFQIDNIPDCRYRLYYAELYGVPDAVCDALVARSQITRIPLIVPDDEPLPGNQFLNIRAMFPPEIIDQFTGDNELPTEILISPQYRARKVGIGTPDVDKDLFFGAIVVVPDPDLVLVDTYEAHFSVGELLNGIDEGLGRCTPPAPSSDPMENLKRLLNFDVVTRASETFIAPGGVAGPVDLAHVDTIVNSGCGTTRTRGGTFSVFSYGLEIAHNPGVDAQGRFYDPIVGPGATLTLNVNDDDDVYARLVRKLFDDLGVFQKQIVCSDVDVPGSVPLPSCGVINASYDNTLDKLGKCIDATRQPKTSALDQNCNAFEVQFGAYQAEVEALLPRPDFDPANRIGELKARLTTIWLLYHDRFLPSVPKGGYTP
jgi:hypothetical protein